MKMSLRKKLLFSAIVLAGLIIGAELGVRILCWVIGYTPYHSVVTKWMVADKEIGYYDYRPNFEGKIYSAEAKINSVGLRGEEIEKTKPAGTWRVLCIGDSTTFGFYVKNGESWPEQLQKILRERFPERKIEVLNAGRVAYSSFQGLRYLEKIGLDFEPDLVIAGFGQNDRRFVLKASQNDNPEWIEQKARSLRWRARVRNSYLLLALGKLRRHLTKESTWEEDVLKLDSQRLPDLHARVDVDDFRDNLRRMAHLCSERNIPIVYLVMSDAPHVLKEFAEARRFRDEKKYDEAVKVFREIQSKGRDPLFRRWFEGLAQYEIGLTREEEGRTTEAQEAFCESAVSVAFWSADGGTAVRFAEDYARAMREVAAEVGAPAVDIAKEFADRPDLFRDQCHYSAEGHRLIAEAVAARLAEAGLLPLNK